jgi:hypothetical protein
VRARSGIPRLVSLGNVTARRPPDRASEFNCAGVVTQVIKLNYRYAISLID